MNNFQAIFDVTIMGHEGGSQDNEGDTVDKGGWTRYGISQFWKDKIDIRNCTEQEAKAFYIEYFFSRIETGYQGLDLFLFDSLLQHDQDACIWLQESLGFTGKDVDGIIGKGTLGRLDSLILMDTPVESIIEKVAAKRMEHYMSIDQDYAKHYRKGWSRRFVDILSLSLHWED
jgi:lysozyme family protein